MPLEKKIDALRETIAFANRVNPKISDKAVDWHIDHSLKVILAVTKVLEKSDPENYLWRFNFIRWFIFITGIIPRGKARAPKAVLPPNDINKDDLLHQVKAAQNQLEQIQNLPLKSNFKHPYFGLLDLKATKKFLDIHTQHHLKIINDIISK